MNKVQVEEAAHSVHREIWLRRQNIWPMGLPPLEGMLDPCVAARVLDLEYEIRERIGGDGSRQWGADAGGFLDRGRGVIAVSGRYPYEVQRFTAAHEIGHMVMHPWVGERVIHRDLPISTAPATRKASYEQEADWFAAFFLMPRKLVEKEFALRFGSKAPLPKSEDVAFHLGVKDTREFFDARPDSLLFATLLARAQSFDRRRFASLAQHFGVSVQAMAIRLRELELVDE
jgi:Zn-dependent peptidase ImmA (M78 family)